MAAVYLSCTQVAGRIGVAPPTLSRYELPLADAIISEADEVRSTGVDRFEWVADSLVGIAIATPIPCVQTGCRVPTLSSPRRIAECRG